MKMNRKGFTLVELLVTILIVGLVIGLTVFGIITLTKDSEDKVNTISVKNVEEAARIYSAEASNDSWKKNDEYEFDAFCTTIGELMNKGFIDKKASFADDLTRNNYVIVKRNKITLAIDSASVIEDNTDDDRICTSQNIIEDEEHTKPSISKVNKYTDRIEIDFNNGSAKSGIKNYKCLYGNSSSNINREGIIEGNKCILDGLKNNKEYYVLIYMNTNKGSSILAEGDREYSTKDFVDTTISQNANKVNITYKDDNIYGEEEYHYIKSGINGTSGENVLSCDFNNNKFTCDETTSVIEKDKWYKVNDNNITITYPEENNKFNIDTKTCDDSNNCKDNNKEIIINKYVVKFYRNDALNVDGNTSEYIEKYCVAANNGMCSIVSPTFTSQVGYSVVGWNRSSSATSSEWNVGATKEINSNVSYYAIGRINKVYIKYNVNGGSLVTTSNEGGSWSTDDTGLVKLDNKVLTAQLNYGANIGSSGLVNYNNADYLNIKRDGYSAVSGAQWKCLSGNCNRNTYSHDGFAKTGYTAASFCDASNGDCTVVLGVNWVGNTYTVNYYLGNGTSTTGATKIGSSTCTYMQTCTLKSWKELGHTFPLSDYEWRFAGWSDSNAVTKSLHADSSKWTYNTVGNRNLYAVGKRTFKFCSGKAPTSVQSTQDQYWNPNSTAAGNLTSINVPGGTAIDGWTFLGYRATDTLSGTITLSSGTQKPAANEFTNMAFRSKYERTIQLKYNPNGGSGSAYYSSKKQYYNSGIASDGKNNGASISTPTFTLEENKFTSPSGYSFLKWAIGSASGTKYSGGASYSGFSPGVSSNTITQNVYATWEKVKYTITYKGGGNVSGNPSEYYVDSNDITLKNPTREGYTFTGWTGSNGTTPDTSVTIEKGSTGNKTYTANWRINKVNIYYRVNGGKLAITSNDTGEWTTNENGTVVLNKKAYTGSINYGDNIGTNGLSNYNSKTVLSISRDGYKAVPDEEWICLSSVCKGTTYSQKGYADTGYTSDSFCDASNGDCTVVLGVNWTPIIYSISYNLNSGSVSGNPSSYTIESGAITLKNPTRDGYVFDGWTGSNGSTASKSVTIAAGSIGNKSYTANWTLNKTTVNANKFACENSRLAVYYVTVCSSNTCTYTKKNGLDSSYSFDLEDTAPTWSINKSNYVDSLDKLSSSCSYSTMYVKASSSMNCRSGASTDASVSRTWNRCTSLYVYPTTMQYRANSDGKLYRWYYSKTYGCYLTGYNLSSSKPSDCGSSSTTNIKYYCVNLGGSHTICQCHGYNIGQNAMTIVTSEDSLKNNSNCTIFTSQKYLGPFNGTYTEEQLVGCTSPNSGSIVTYQCVE